MNRRAIGVFTSSRADLGPLGPVIRELDDHDEVALVVIATGTHLAERFGGRLSDISLSPKSKLEILDVGLEGTSGADLGAVYGRIGSQLSTLLESIRLDILVLLGDRWELLAAAGAALIHGVPLAHVHGGETSEGAIDERIRHGITKLSDLHFCATVESARRIRHLGEQAWRIMVTGAPGLDRLKEVRALSTEELSELIGRDAGSPFGVVLYHAPTVDRSKVRVESQAVFDAAASILQTCLLIHPGADPGADIVIEEMERAVKKHANLVSIKNLGEEFLRVLASADLLVGNSSSGIIEAASLHLPVVDVGDRQRGRLRPRNVINAHDIQAIPQAIRRALSEEFRGDLSELKNPYGDGQAAPRIVGALLDAPLDRLAHKPWAALGLSDEVAIHDLTIGRDASIREVMAAIERGANQIAIMTDDDGTLIGTLTDGDLRRALLSGASLGDPAFSYVTKVPVLATPSDGRGDVLSMMHRNAVARVPVVDPHGRVVGLHVMQSLVRDFLLSGHRHLVSDEPS